MPPMNLHHLSRASLSFSIFHGDRTGDFISTSTTNTSFQLESTHNQEPKAFGLLLNALYLYVFMYVCEYVIRPLGRREIQEELVCFKHWKSKHSKQVNQRARESAKYHTYLLFAWSLLLRIKENVCCAPKFARPEDTGEFCNPPLRPNFIKISPNFAFPLEWRHEAGQVPLTPRAQQTPCGKIQAAKCSQRALSLEKSRFSLFIPRWFIRVRYPRRSSRVLTQGMLQWCHGRGLVGPQCTENSLEAGLVYCFGFSS